MSEDIKKLDERELKRNLITSDFRGKKFKEECLHRLMEIAYNNGYNRYVTDYFDLEIK